MLFQVFNNSLMVLADFFCLWRLRYVLLCL